MKNQNCVEKVQNQIATVQAAIDALQKEIERAALKKTESQAVLTSLDQAAIIKQRALALVNGEAGALKELEKKSAQVQALIEMLAACDTLIENKQAELLDLREKRLGLVKIDLPRAEIELFAPVFNAAVAEFISVLEQARALFNRVERFDLLPDLPELPVFEGQNLKRAWAWRNGREAK